MNGRDSGTGVLKLLCLIIITIDRAQTTDGAGDDDAAIGWYQEIR